MRQAPLSGAVTFGYYQECYLLDTTITTVNCKRNFLVVFERSSCVITSLLYGRHNLFLLRLLDISPGCLLRASTLSLNIFNHPLFRVELSPSFESLPMLPFDEI